MAAGLNVASGQLAHACTYFPGCCMFLDIHIAGLVPDAIWPQVAEMKSFLNDYGMVWVGDPLEQQHEDLISPTGHGPSSAAAVNQGAAMRVGPGAGMPLPPKPPTAEKHPLKDISKDPRRRSYNGISGTSSPNLPSAGGLVAGPGPSSDAQREPLGRPSSSGAGNNKSVLVDLDRPSTSGSGSGGQAPMAGGLARRSYDNLAPLVKAPVPPPLPRSLSTAAAASPAIGALLHNTPGAGPGHGPGPSASGGAGGAGGSSGSSQAAGASGGLPFRMSDLVARVDELNQLAGDGCGRLVPGGQMAGGHVLRTPDPVKLIIFKDGLQVGTA